jgi:DNA-binding HxlR family transcriptional regulator
VSVPIVHPPAEQALAAHADGSQASSPDCDIATHTVLARVSNKWAPTTMAILERCDEIRYSDLKRRLGSVSQKMLSATLRELVRDGLVSRRQDDAEPPRVYYRLTELGVSLSSALDSVRGWARDNAHLIAQARQAFDSRRR